MDNKLDIIILKKKKKRKEKLWIHFVYIIALPLQQMLKIKFLKHYMS